MGLVYFGQESNERADPYSQTTDHTTLDEVERLAGPERGSPAIDLDVSAFQVCSFACLKKRRSLMPRLIALGASFSLILGLFGAREASGQRAAPAAEWKPDAKAVRQLGPSVKLDSYTIRIPKDYELQETPQAPFGAKFWAWAGPARADGTEASS